MIWFEECVKITPEYAEMLRRLVAFPIVAMYCSVGTLLLGLLMLTFPALRKILGRRKRLNCSQHQKEYVDSVLVTPHQPTTYTRLAVAGAS
jgi:hypothetical protein